MNDQNDSQNNQPATGGLNLSEAMPGSSLGDVLLGGQAQDTNVRRERVAVNADKHGWWWAVGRRKNAIARVRMKNADGNGAVRFQKL